MICSLEELRRKEVINIKTGERLGYGTRLFGILGKEDDVVIRCSDIKVVGRDIVLVETAEQCVKEISTKNGG